ncbi:MAG: hypothetical protein MJA29_09470 [Candidatus Omnitrophica bacterium]|nr:hypothetical protein [Candidatus Omnitrophota bacterium]
MDDFDWNAPQPPLSMEVMRDQLKKRAQRGRKIYNKFKKEKAIRGLKAMLREGKITEEHYNKAVKELEKKK